MNNERQMSLISFVVSVAFWFLLTSSLPMAIGILVLIFIHEMGHFYAARMKGMRVSLPVFTPLGAMVRLDGYTASARDEAFVAFAGPLVGGIASMITIVLGYFLGGGLLFQLGVWGVVINLLNLVPLEPLDGGKISLAIERRLYFLGIPLFIYFMMQIGLNLFNIIMAVLILREAWTAIQMRNQQADVAPSFFRVPILTRIGYAGAYAALAALLAWVALQPSMFLGVLVSLGL
jgi:Zn-dependent protease